MTKIFILNNYILLNKRQEMDGSGFNKYYFSFIVLCIMIGLGQPVMAQGENISISYRGAGGYFVGDMIIFDGKNSAGNDTVLEISGPNLAPLGVPLDNLNGTPGTGTLVPVNKDGSWKFIWYSSKSIGGEKLETARYTITAADTGSQEKTSSTSILLKKPEFYINPVSNPINVGDYIQLNGYVEQGTTQVRIDISDSTATLLRTYTISVGGSGYFNYGYRVDIPPGQYFVVVSSPSQQNILRTVLTIISPAVKSPVPTSPNQVQTSIENVTVTGTTSPVAKRPVPLSTLTIITGLIISGTVILASKRIRADR
jgi:hypothetical protein